MMFSHSPEAFRSQATADDPVITRLVCELSIDVGPVDAYMILAEEFDAEYSFLLESGEKVTSTDPDGQFAAGGPGESRQYSFIGYDPAAAISITEGDGDIEYFNARYDGLLDIEGEDTISTLRSGLPDVETTFDDSTARFEGGLVGFMAYDAVYDLWLNNREAEREETELPDAQFVLNTKTLIFDHKTGDLSLVFTPLVRPTDDPTAMYEQFVREAGNIEALLAETTVGTNGFNCVETTSGSEETYREAVKQTKEHILDGDIYQGVISREKTFEGDIDPYGLYKQLLEDNPSPYMYHLQFGDRSVIGASPETLVTVRSDTVISNPLAGTCLRGKNPIQDRNNAGKLLADDKEQAEHVMLVDLARNDVRRVSDAGSVSVDEFMNVIKHSSVQHIESVVTGDLSEEYDAFDALEAAFPVGTLSGAPKIRAMEIIDEIEETPRGIYGGGIGYVSWSGEADFGIAIRTATIHHRERDHVTIRAGAGIVADSDPASEYEETEQKLHGIQSALENITTNDSSQLKRHPIFS